MTMQYDESGRPVADPDDDDEVGRYRPETDEPVGDPEPETIESDDDQPIVVGEAEQVGEAERLETEPADAEYLETEPVETEYVETERVDAEAGDTEPVETEYVEAERVDAEAGDTEPVATEPVEAEAVGAEPVDAEPTEAPYVATELVDAQPVEAEVAAADAGDDPLLAKWHKAQHRFVDDPSEALHDAAILVQEAAERASSAIHAGSSTGEDESGPNTEQLRIAMQRYHEVFEQLLVISGPGASRPEDAMPPAHD